MNRQRALPYVFGAALGACLALALLLLFLMRGASPVTWFASASDTQPDHSGPIAGGLSGEGSSSSFCGEWRLHCRRSQ